MPAPTLFSPLGTSEQWLHKLQTVAPPAFAVGAGAAGILGLATMLKELKTNREQKTVNNDTLTVPIPQKVAAFPGLAGVGKAVGQNLAKYPGRWAAGAAGAVGGGLEIAHDIGGSAASTASQVPSNPWADGLMTAGVGIPAGLIGYGLIDSALKTRQRAQLQQRLDKAKSEYGTMLGETLGSANAAKVAAEEFPNLIGFCSAIAEQGLEEHEKQAGAGAWLLSAPGAAAVLAGVLAHKWMYNRQNELNALHSTGKPQPPKQIRLVSAPAPAAPAPPQPLQLEDKPDEEPIEAPGLKSAGVEELVGILGAGSMMSEGKKTDPNAPPPPPVQPHATKVGPGVIQISGENGPTEIEAEDPGAAQALSANTAQLTKLMRMFQSHNQAMGGAKVAFLGFGGTSPRPQTTQVMMHDADPKMLVEYLKGEMDQNPKDWEIHGNPQDGMRVVQRSTKREFVL